MIDDLKTTFITTEFLHFCPPTLSRRSEGAHFLTASPRGEKSLASSEACEKGLFTGFPGKSSHF